MYFSFSFFLLFSPNKLIELVGGGSVINQCLHRLVLKHYQNDSLFGYICKLHLNDQVRLSSIFYHFCPLATFCKTGIMVLQTKSASLHLLHLSHSDPGCMNFFSLLFRTSLRLGNNDKLKLCVNIFSYNIHVTMYGNFSELNFIVSLFLLRISNLFCTPP